MNRNCQENRAIVPEWASALMEAVPMPAAIVSPEGRVLYANGCLWLIAEDAASCAVCDQGGAGRSNLALDRFRGLNRLLAAAARMGSASGEIAFDRFSDDESCMTAQVHARALPTMSDRGTLILVTFWQGDAAEMLRHELGDYASRYQGLLQTSMDRVFLMDLEGNLASVNRSWQQRMGYAVDEILGENGGNLVDCDSRRAYLVALECARSGQYIENVEFRVGRKDGTQVDIEIRTYPVRIAGQRVILGITRDISERKKTEEMLAALNRDWKATISDLERSNQELRDFAHVAAHDLKAPLRGIATLADWISQDYADKIDEQGQENLKLLRQRVERMTLLINGILRYAEIGHGDCSIENVDAGAIVAEVIEQIAPPPHITIRVDSPLPAVSCEKAPLTQVFLNLISNAVKYMDKPKGEIHIAAVEDGDFWRFTVADNGTGIESRHFDRLFQMFQTLVPSNNGESTGIGLAVVKKIVQMYGGCVGVASEPGRGSTFFFTLPRQKERTIHEKH